MKEYIDKTALMKKVHTGMNIIEVMQTIINAPAADVVPWEWLERYADCFFAEVSMPEFVREAKMVFYKAMQGGVIDG